mgnify:CR=1 FL=1
MTRWVAIAALACSAPARVVEPPAPALEVWPADDVLRDLVEAAAPRIEAATGLRGVASQQASAVPLFWSSDGEWSGLAYSHEGELDWLAIDPRVPQILRVTATMHEVLHGFGAAHVARAEGVLSPELWPGRPWYLTAADLGSVCAVAPCTHMVSERDVY